MNHGAQTIATVPPALNNTSVPSSTRLGVFVRLRRTISVLAETGLNLLYATLIAFVAGALTGGVGLVLVVPLGLYFLTRCLFKLLFFTVCRIEESVQTVHGRSRCQSDTVRERTHNGELAYTRHTTNFRTIQSDSFVFRTEGFRELRSGDRVRLRLFRWTRFGRIQDYDILGFDLDF